MKRLLFAVLLALASFSAFAATATLTWTNAVDARIDGTRIERKDAACAAAGSFVKINSVVVGVATVPDSTILDGKTYCYRARHAAGLEFSAYSNTAELIVPVTVPTAIPAPLNLRIFN